MHFLNKFNGTTIEWLKMHLWSIILLYLELISMM